MRQNGNDLWSYVGEMLNSSGPAAPAVKPLSVDEVTTVPEPAVAPQDPAASLRTEVLAGLHGASEAPQMLDEATLMAISPSASSEIVQAVVDNQGVLNNYGINTPERMSMFLGQMAHESAGFKAMNEYAGGARYEGRADLGNTSPGDGEKYKGRGLIQLTGKYNYDKYGKKIGADLVNNPELAANPKVAVEIAAAYWKDKGLNEQADLGNFGEVTRRIQGTSTDAVESRGNYFSRASSAIKLREAGEGFSKVSGKLFNMLSPEERDNLLQEARKNEPLFYKKNKVVTSPAILEDREQANISDAYNNRQDEWAYLNTWLGKNRLVNQELVKAIDANVTAGGDIAAQAFKDVRHLASNVEVRSSEDTLAAFKKALDDYKIAGGVAALPFSNSDKIMENTRTRAAAIEKEYVDMSYGSWLGGPGEVLNKIALVGADIAGLVTGSLTDPVSTALMMYGGAKIKAGKAVATIATNAVKAFLGFGAEQIPVQANREELGLESGLVPGLANAALGSVGLAAFQAVGHAAASTWRWGSARYGKQATVLAEELKSRIHATNNLEPEVKAHLSTLADNVATSAEKYKTNPYGDGFYAKAKFEANLRGVAEDFVKDVQIRATDAPTRPYVPTIRDYAAAEQSLAQLVPEGTPKEFTSALLDSFDWFKKGYHDTPILRQELHESSVPVLKDSKVITFKSEADAQAFMKSKEGLNILGEQDARINYHPGNQEFFISRVAELEPKADLSGRMVGDALSGVSEGKVGAVDVAGHADDLKIASDFPTYSNVQPYRKPVESASVTLPKYEGDLDFKAANDYLKQIDEMPNTAEISPEVYEANFNKMSTLYSPETKKALLSDVEYQDLLSEYRALKENVSPDVKSCFFGDE